MRPITWITRAGIVSVFATLLPQQAFASGFLAARFGGEHGHPTTDDTTAIYYNPAGLALRSGTHISINGLMAYRKASYDRSPEAIDTVVATGSTGAGTPASDVAANSGESTLSNILASPFVGAASDLGIKNLAVGLGFFVPFGGQAEWDKNSAYEGSARLPGAVDGPQRWATISGTLRELYFSAAVAYRLPKQRLSFGAAFNVVRSEIDTVRARNADGTDTLLDSAGNLQEGRSYLKADATDVSAAFGVVYQPTETSWIGASYQSQPGFGENTLSGTLDNKLGTTASVRSNIEVTQSLPDVIRLGGRYRPRKNLELRLSGEYARWSVFDKQCIINADDAARKCVVKADGASDTANGGAGILVVIERDWHDAMGVRGGASYWVTPTVEAYGGLGYDGNAVPDATIEAALIDMGKVTASLGGKFTLLDNKLGLDLGYTHVFYFDRPVAARPRDAGGKQVSSLPPSKNPDGAGRYEQMIGVLSLQVEYSF